jgi:hypothetical protein
MTKCSVWPRAFGTLPAGSAVRLKSRLALYSASGVDDPARDFEEAPAFPTAFAPESGVFARELGVFARVDPVYARELGVFARVDAVFARVDAVFAPDLARAADAGFDPLPEPRFGPAFVRLLGFRLAARFGAIREPVRLVAIPTVCARSMP